MGKSRRRDKFLHLVQVQVQQIRSGVLCVQGKSIVTLQKNPDAQERGLSDTSESFIMHQKVGVVRPPSAGAD